MSERNIKDHYCYRVNGIYVPYETPADIDRRIDEYILKIERCTAVLEDCFFKGDRAGFISGLEAVLALLEPIYAKQCISYVTAMIVAAKDSKKSEKYLERLLQQSIADFLLLSIELQKAQRLGISHAMKYRDVEKNENIAHGLAAISRMIASGSYRDAGAMATEMTGLNAVFAKLEAMIKSQQYDRAVELASSTEKEYIGFIQSKHAAKMSKTVLAVDDRQEILTNVSSALKNHYRVFGALSGKLALDIMARQKIDLFYLDIEMPEMDGFELVQRIRSKPEHAKTPIIFLTANASRENIERGISLGVDDYIVKPSNHVNLLVKARKYMDE